MEPGKISDADLLALNERLKESFGSTINGKAYYRVSWAPDQLEHRKGLYRDFQEGTSIFIREEKGVREAQKYKWLGDKYVLEKLVPQTLPEIMTQEKLVYEMIVDFPVGKPPWFEAIEYFIKVTEDPEAEARKFVESEEKKEDYRYEKEVRYFEEVLAEGGES